MSPGPDRSRTQFFQSLLQYAGLGYGGNFLLDAASDCGGIGQLQDSTPALLPPCSCYTQDRTLRVSIHVLQGRVEFVKL